MKYSLCIASSVAAFAVMQLAPSPHILAQSPAPRRAEIVAAARAVIAKARYATLATAAVDDAQPQARIVDPMAPDTNFIVWIATNPATRKVAEIKKSGRATLLYFDATALEYVTLLGTASLVTDPMEKAKHWKRDWDPFYKDGPAAQSVVLIRFATSRLEVVSPSRKMNNDAVTWRPVSIEIGPPKGK